MFEEDKRSGSGGQVPGRLGAQENKDLPPLRLVFVVQRYGEGVDGGAEIHCRLVAERLARRHRVEVLTSCAKDYITWANDLSAGLSIVGGVPVRRFRVKRPRDPDRFGRMSQRVLHRTHDVRDELKWLEEQGPYMPSLVRYMRESRKRYDYFVFFSYRYYHSYHGICSLADRSLLVPTAERDDVLGLSLFRTLFQLPRAIVYNSFEEREMIWQATGNQKIRGDVVGVGAQVPDRMDPAAFRGEHGVPGRYAIYVGRVDPNKGCGELFHFFRRYREETRSDLCLVIVGGKTMDIPGEPFIRYLGFLSEEQKWGALAGAQLLIMPSELESLSMVVLESWAAGKPVLVNGRCDVLRGQCRRSNGGLYYQDYYEFREALALLEQDESLRRALGRNGQRFFHEHYRWEVIEKKYERLIQELLQEDRAPSGKGGSPLVSPTSSAGPTARILSRWRRRLG